MLKIDDAYRHFACIGAGITLVALGIDPFFQQTIKYTSQSVVDSISEARAVAAYGYNGIADFTLGGEFGNICEC
jgi:hypothetical protein